MYFVHNLHWEERGQDSGLCPPELQLGEREGRGLESLEGVSTHSSDWWWWWVARTLVGPGECNPCPEHLGSLSGLSSFTTVAWDLRLRAKEKLYCLF